MGLLKNTLRDLNNHLFEQMERLNDESLSDDQLKVELSRSAAMSKIATQIISNGNLVIKAQKAYEDALSLDAEKPKMLEG